MARIDEDIEQLREQRTRFGETVSQKVLPSGARLIEVADYRMPPGWDIERATILFVVPTAFPGAQPDCFWVEPKGLRYGGGHTPQNTNDQNVIPEVGNRGTWFSWHLQSWDPNRHRLWHFFRAIESRLNPAR